MSWKPDGHSTVSPYLIVRDARATLDFLEKVFGAARLELVPREDGEGVTHAEARIDDTVIMMGEGPDAGDGHVHVYVSDADATFARAVAAGGHIVQALRRAGDGNYRGGVADGNGAVWWISQKE